MTIQLTASTILDRTLLNNYLQNFNDRCSEVDASIAKLNSDIATTTAEKQGLLISDMQTVGDVFKLPLNNCIAKLVNMKQALEVAVEQKNTFASIVQNPEVEELLKSFYTNSYKEIAIYQTVEEKIIYDELAQILARQLELFSKLNGTRNDIEYQVAEFSRICDSLGYSQFKLSVGFHDNAQYPNKNVGHTEAITFNCQSIKNALQLHDMSKRVY